MLTLMLLEPIMGSSSQNFHIEIFMYIFLKIQNILPALNSVQINKCKHYD